jgi:hypothetical protein
MADFYYSLVKYNSTFFEKHEIKNSDKLSLFYSILQIFLSKFDWILSYSAKDLIKQEKRGDKRLKGVCYDACKYLAQILVMNQIKFKSYWICGYDIKSIKLWFSGQSLHSFNICIIDDYYFFADCFFAYILTQEKYICGFKKEEDALAWASEIILPKSHFVLREFNPLAVKMGNHI